MRSVPFFIQEIPSERGLGEKFCNMTPSEKK